MAETSHTRTWQALAGGAATGVGLFLSDHPARLWPLQVVAFLPLLWALGRAASWRAAALAGVALGVFYTTPLAFMLEFPLSMAAPLGLALTALWVAAALGAWRVLDWPQPLGALAAGAVFVLIEWLSYTAIPIWGTAQCFARVWSAAPWAIQFVAVTGISGLVFVLTASQALALAVLRRPRRARRATLFGLAAILVTPAIYDVVRWRETPHGQVRVAAIGWIGAPASRAVLDGTLRPLIAQAAARGARLVVTPEVGLIAGPGARDLVIAELGELARTHQVHLAVGYFDRAQNDNRIAFLAPDGRLLAEYRKTHLIPFVERYRAGDGSLVVFDLGAARLGGMICQDDNFVDLARGYGRRGAALVAVPTNDWRQVAPYHLENALLRGIENRYAIVRAASNGQSVIASARGEILASADHFRRGTQLIVADVPLYPAGTLYSAAGEWLPALCALLLVAGAIWEVRRRRRQ